MKKIKLTQGKYAIVDDEDFDLLNTYSWSFHRASGSKKFDGKGGYAISHAKTKGSQKIYMHRFIMNVSKGQEIDHINRNKLDNRKNNLRVTSRSINQFNQDVRRDNSSGYTGVSLQSGNKNLWRARLSTKLIGVYKNKEDAHKSYLLAKNNLLRSLFNGNI